MRRSVLTVACLAACTSDSTYSDIARDHLIKGGPAAACCSQYGGAISSAECAVEAETKCSFAKSANVTVTAVIRNASNNATVNLALAGPNGSGICTFRVSDFGSGKRGGLRIQGGTCERR
jgi:hypothetical protein